MLTPILTILRQPASRRKWLTIISGSLIVLGLIALYGFGLRGLWAASMLAAAFVAGSDIAWRAFHALRIRHFSIELLVTVAAIGALFIGEYWESAAVTFLFSFGAWLEARTLRQTRGALADLLKAAPEIATVIRDGQPVEIAASAVQPNEVVLVRAGNRIPVDGEVIDGNAAVSEAAITGEPIPAEKAPGSHVHAGTIAENGVLRIRATGIGADTTLARIIRRVEEAQEERAPSQRMIERFAQWYTPGIMVLALGAWAVTQDIRLALTLLVVACPGALVISTPVSIVAGIGRAARSGILIKGGQHLESAGRIDMLALDKTGTLTEGRPSLVEMRASWRHRSCRIAALGGDRRIRLGPPAGPPDYRGRPCRGRDSRARDGRGSGWHGSGGPPRRAAGRGRQPAAVRPAGHRFDAEAEAALAGVLGAGARRSSWRWTGASRASSGCPTSPGFRPKAPSPGCAISGWGASPC